jgi:hypothetical protein
MRMYRWSVGTIEESHIWATLLAICSEFIDLPSIGGFATAEDSTSYARVMGKPP